MGRLAAAGFGAWAAMLAPAEVHASERVDLELVLAVDVSMSMDAREIDLQRQGYVRAFRSSEVIGSILQNGEGRIAVTYMEWAGDTHVRFAVPWRLIDSETAAGGFADELENLTPTRVDRTSISNALAAAARAFEDNQWDGARKVIDLSGDGPNNEGDPLPRIRDELVAQGVTINGLALMINPGSKSLGIDNLDEYYTQCATGGPGAFVLAVRNWSQFPDALRLKLHLEITGRQLPAQFTPVSLPPLVDCQVGEKIWRDFLRRIGGKG
jgi:hypothetical protein